MFGGKLYVLPALVFALQTFATTVDYKTLKTDKGDGIPDFSFCGYHASDDPLPPSDRQPATIINASSGDQTQRIQNELNKISAAGGGVLALGAGKYHLSAGLVIPNGTVLRGAGSDKTTLLPKDGSMHVITMGSDDINDPKSGNSVSITDDYVPVGATNVTVDSASGLKVGQDVWVQRQVTQEWIDAMGMGDLVRDGKHQTWLSTSSFVQQPRKIQSISGKVITVDIPLTDTLDSEYMSPELAPYDVPEGPSEMGVEALSMTVEPTCSGVVIDDDSCSGAAVSFLSWTVDSYLRDVSLTGFNNVIGISKNARRLTIQNVSITRDHATDNGAGYAADIGISGTQILVIDSSTNGPQDGKSFPVVTQSLTPGPNAVVRYHAEQVQKGIQPHARWAHGFLVDNSTVTTSFINRGTDGSGHGWAINSGVMWNVDGDYEVQSPPLGTNWGIGCNGDKQSDSNGTFVAQGHTIQPASLFEQQLSDRGLA
ncbi:uncharacterized protein TRUGW13939_02502 [Talaromyces rugulosus]|uniref:Pectate lyase superfamily protein domain-containing protein n=1 Tax=Talaromyces rugulosus TaxID=121627 RepID=A0A7H8QNH4_TALRU|nr:uncharacterized protein TRUGW13939_02502 [Talaromyces rugulosus]QKX55409.1 hypothetical protein TRUGW13939_02502 [Talaromyces rugulosus]